MYKHNSHFICFILFSHFFVWSEYVTLYANALVQTYHTLPIFEFLLYTNSSQYIIVSSLLKAPQLTLFDHEYPDWSITVGYIIGFSSFMWIPIYMVYKLVWTPGSLKQVRLKRIIIIIIKTEKKEVKFNCIFCCVLQRLAVCLRPERTIPEIHSDNLNMVSVPWKW